MKVHFTRRSAKYAADLLSSAQPSFGAEQLKTGSVPSFDMLHVLDSFCLFPVQRLLQAAEPGGNIMESVDVQKLGPSVWSVSLTPSSCGTGLELLQIAQAQVISGNTSSGHALFKSINATENSTILVSREQAATPPIGGTFDLGLQGEIVKGN